MEILHGRTTEKIKIDFQQLLLHFNFFFVKLTEKIYYMNYYIWG